MVQHLHTVVFSLIVGVNERLKTRVVVVQRDSDWRQWGRTRRIGCHEERQKHIWHSTRHSCCKPRRS